MHKTILVTTIAVALLATATDSLSAQRNNRRNRWRRPAEITNRLTVSFHEVKAPASDGDKVADLNTIELVRNAVATKQASLLYLHDKKDPEDTRQRFEASLFRYSQAGDELGLRMRLVHCGRIDIADDAAMQKRYGDDVPLFIAFDKDGKQVKELSMAGYEAEPQKLASLLDRAAKGTSKTSMKTWAKRYAKLLEDLEELFQEKASIESEKAKSRRDKVKVQDADRQLARLDKTLQKMMAKEQKLLQVMRMPEPGGQSVGGVEAWRSLLRDARKDGNTGKGNTGKGNTGEGNTGKGNTGRGNAGEGKNGGGRE
ncbi:MAG: pentapeptide repeat-containing protein [Planctomycetota bacterium]